MNRQGNDQIYAAAIRWRDRCFIADGSVFTDRAVWNAANIAEFEKRFVVGFIGGEQPFYEKLQTQLQGAPTGCIQLAAEMLWLMFLYPDDVISIARKRDDIRKVWGWSGSELPEDHPLLHDDVLHGIAGAGTFFNTGRYIEVQFLIRTMKRWKQLEPGERNRLLTTPELIATWFDVEDSVANRMMRHIVLHLLMPEDFLPIASSGHKRRILRAFGSRVDSSQDWSDVDLDAYPWAEIDSRLAKIEKNFVDSRPPGHFHFYLPEVKPLWERPRRPRTPRPPEVDHAAPDSVREPASPGELSNWRVGSDLFVPPDERALMLRLLRQRRNLILQGPPGVGKSLIARVLADEVTNGDATRQAMVQFHQSFAYEDFVQGYRPEGSVFARRDGLFVRKCREAARVPDKPFVLVIDEINRGNLSRIFGELMLLLEGDKRGPRWALDLAYSQAGDQKFFVPENLLVIGLMNTADRSLAMVDYALRRRFAFHKLVPRVASDAFEKHLVDHGVPQELVDRIQRNVGALNEQIAKDTQNLGPGFQVGHSYFCSFPDSGVPDEQWYREIVQSSLDPLIQEYWFDQPHTARSMIELLLS